MNLLKNFGTGGSTMGSTNIAKPLGSKNNYFSTLKLQQQTSSGPGKSKQNSKVQKRKGPPPNFIPNKFALSFDPPAIILQYKDPQNNKLYHHKMKLRKLKKDTEVKDALSFLKKKHNPYFANQSIDESQIQKLIQKLKKGISDNRKSQMQDVQQQDDFDFDYDDDFDDL